MYKEFDSVVDGRTERGENNDLTRNFINSLDRFVAGLSSSDSRKVLLEGIKTALQSQPFPIDQKSYKLENWLTACERVGLLDAERHGQILDLCHVVWDQMPENESLSINNQENLTEKESELGKKLREKMLRYQKENIGQQTVVKNLLTVMQKFPITVEKSRFINTWLLEMFKKGEFPESEYYRYLDVLTSET